MSEEVTQLMGQEEIGVIISPGGTTDPSRHHPQLHLKLIDRTRSYAEAHLIVSGISRYHQRPTLHRRPRPTYRPPPSIATSHLNWHDDAGGKG